MGHHGRDLRLWMVKAGPGGAVEVEMERSSGSQDLPCRQRPSDLLMPVGVRTERSQGGDSSSK